ERRQHRRSARLLRFGRHRRWPARQCAAVRSTVLFLPSDRDFQNLGRRHGLSWRVDRRANRRPAVRPTPRRAGADGARPMLARRANRHLPRPYRQFHSPRALGASDRRALGRGLSGNGRPAAPSQPNLRSAPRGALGVRHSLYACAIRRAAPSGRHHRGLCCCLRRGAHFLRILSRTRSAPGGSWARAHDGDGPFASARRRRPRSARVERRSAGNLIMTKLLDEIRAMIAERGSITVEQYMQLALTHPDLGYYMNRDPFGATGDFTTAPEVSQMFGELIGLWTAEVWSSMGSPDPVRLVELGPGRGTLMSDALRAARIVPAFRNALDVRLIETSPTLASMQHELLIDCGVAVSWAQSLKDVPDGPAIVIGNEFLDALPVRQFVRVSGQWRERTVRLNGDGKLVFDVADKPEPYIRANAANGEVLEVNPSGHRLMFELGARLVKQGGAALLIDYGHAITSYGDTLQALRAHRYVDPLAAPGDCDLTAHVDFAA